MNLDSMLDPNPMTVGESLEEAKALGREGGWVIETRHDPFVLLATAAAQRTGLHLGTAVAVGFARNPMTLAYQANDLQLLSGGKFSLGLGTQVKAHIERRYSMPWGKPAARMRDMVQAIHAIWDSWEAGNPLVYQGEFYHHTLMTQPFSPGANPYGRPRLLLGALGPAMTELAGEVADGLVVHRLMSQRFLSEVTLPLLEKGMAKRTRPLARPFEVVYPPFVVAGTTDEAHARQLGDTRSQIAFYASTPSYRPVLDVHGWGNIGEELHTLSVSGRWPEMPTCISEAMVETFAVITDPASLTDQLKTRFGTLVDRIILYPEGSDHH